MELIFVVLYTAGVLVASHFPEEDKWHVLGAAVGVMSVTGVHVILTLSDQVCGPYVASVVLVGVFLSVVVLSSIVFMFVRSEVTRIVFVVFEYAVVLVLGVCNTLLFLCFSYFDVES
jgi:predicted membrane-bound spermidine synthase